jgi:hypothetical protein
MNLKYTHKTNLVSWCYPAVPLVIELVLIHGNRPYIIMVDVVQTPMFGCDCSNLAMRREM